MTKELKRWGLIFLFFAIPFLFSFTQGEWTKVTEDSGVVVQSTTSMYTDNSGIRHEVVLFKFENTNKFPVTVSYYLEVWYGEHCRSCGLQRPNDYDRKLSLDAGQVITGSVKDIDNTLMLHSGYPDKPGHSKLTKFNLADFRVIP